MALSKDKLAALSNSIIDPSTPVAHYRRVIVYGDFGTGKSTWACSSGLKTLVLDASEGFDVVGALPNVTVMKYQGLSQIDALGQALQEGLMEFDVVVLDEVSSIYQMDLEVVVAAREKSTNIRDDAIPDQRDYLAAQNRLMLNLRPLLKAPCHVVLLAHERKTTDKTTGVTTYESDFAPRLSKEINRGLQMIGRLVVNKDGQRELIVRPVKGTQAKTRLDVPNNPTLAQVIAAQRTTPPVANPTNTPDVARDISDSVPQHISEASTDVSDNLSI
jgi:phage nucleotide-binding protein